MCILGVVPLLVTSIVIRNELWELVMVVLLLMIIAAEVYLFVLVGMEKGAYEQLLQIGDYTKEGKEADKAVARISAAYWCLAAAIYLAYSFWSGDWGQSWVVWPVAGVLFFAIAGVIHARKRR